MSKFKLPVNYNELHWIERKRVRKQYMQEQEYKCYHCGSSLKEAPSDEILDMDINFKLFPKSFF